MIIRYIILLEKKLVIADTLSRNFHNSETLPEDDELVDETEALVNLVTNSFQVKPYFLEEIIIEQTSDSACQTLKQYYFNGWPDKSRINNEILPYYLYLFEISFSEAYLLIGSRLIIPPSLQMKCLEFLHQGHQDIVKCRSRAKASIWWLGLSTQIENLIRTCPQCVENKVNSKEPFIEDKFPERPWQKIALDLFKYESWYLIVTDYFSRFFEIFKLTSLTETVIISKLKSCFLVMNFLKL